MKSNMWIGLSIRSLRTSGGISQAELAERCGLAQANLSHIERGVRDLTISTLNRIALALGVPASGLLADAESSGSGRDAIVTDRVSLERISQAVTGEGRKARPNETGVVRDLKLLMPWIPKGARVKDSELYAAWLRIKERISAPAIRNLLTRIEKSRERLRKKRLVPSDEDKKVDADIRHERVRKFTDSKKAIRWLRS